MRRSVCTQPAFARAEQNQFCAVRVHARTPGRCNPMRRGGESWDWMLQILKPRIPRMVRGGKRRIAQDETFPLQRFASKINNQANLQTSNFQIVDHLCLFDWPKFSNGFQIHEYFRFDDQIRNIGMAKYNTFVSHPMRLLANESHLLQLQLMLERFLINCLQKATPKLRVNFHRRTKNLSR